jgi:hypothetical protein
VIVVEASAYSGTYAQDRGLGSVTGAGKQFANQVAFEAVRAIREVYIESGAEGRFQFHYLPMPLLLRQSGSFGTHWMLQPYIAVRHGEQSVTLPGSAVREILEYLHRRPVYPPEGPAGRVWAWAQEDPAHKKAWEGIREALAN